MLQGSIVELGGLRVQVWSKVEWSIRLLGVLVGVAQIHAKPVPALLI